MFLMLLLFFSASYAQMPGMAYQFLMDPKQGNHTYESKLESVQAMFIEQMFVKELFKTSSLLQVDDDDDMLNMNQSNELMNAMFAREISKYLAKQDLLNLKDKYLQGLE